MRTGAALVLAVAALTGCGGEEPEPAAAPSPRAAAGDHPGLRVFLAQGCGTCHRLAAASSQGGVGPDLDAALEGQDRGRITASIVAPAADAAAGTAAGMMPEDYAERMSDQELEDLVAFLERAAAR